MWAAPSSGRRIAPCAARPAVYRLADSCGTPLPTEATASPPGIRPTMQCSWRERRNGHGIDDRLFPERRKLAGIARQRRVHFRSVQPASRRGYRDAKNVMTRTTSPAPTTTHQMTSASRRIPSGGLDRERAATAQMKTKANTRMNRSMSFLTQRAYRRGERGAEGDERVRCTRILGAANRGGGAQK